MGQPIKLEDFGSPYFINPSDDPENQAILSEDVRLSAYESGYQAGWDDAVSAQSTEQEHIGADLAQSLNDISFGYVEARNHVLNSLKPIFSDMIGLVLPKLAQDTLAAHVLEGIDSAAGEAADTPVEIVLHPDNAQKLAPQLTSASGLPLRMVEDPTLDPGQIYFKSGATEHSLDLTKALTGIETAVSAFFDEHERSTQSA